MNVETVLVCQSVASGTELARTETQEEVPAGVLKRRMGSNLSKIAATSLLLGVTRTLSEAYVGSEYGGKACWQRAENK